MARSWGLMPSFVDVLENHHAPELAQRDSVLVRLVTTADRFLLTKVESLQSTKNGRFVEQERQRFVQLGKGLFGETEWAHVEKALEQEYARVLPIAKAGLKGLLGRNTGDSERSSDNASKHAPQLDRDARVKLPQDLSQSKSSQAQTGVRTARSGSMLTTFLTRCKSFIRQLR
jgi:hypothetical protein